MIQHSRIKVPNVQSKMNKPNSNSMNECHNFEVMVGNMNSKVG